MRAPRLALLSWFLAPLLLALTVWVYWPGGDGPNLLDDRSNVGVVRNLDVQPEAAADYVLGNRSGPLGRPLSMATFVLEELYLEGTPSVRKRVNILLHALNGALLLWLCVLLFGHARFPAHRGFALAVAGAWLLTPLYVSTVLYVVQRMAMLPVTFMLLACITYCYWRRVLLRRPAGWFGAGLLLGCIVAAVLAKENGLLVVPVLVLLELLWFEGRVPADRIAADRIPADRILADRIDPVLRRGSLVLLGLGGLAALVGLALGWEWIVAGYGSRDFSLAERLLTQSRILWDYLGQLLWADLPRLGVFHDDYPLSTGLLQPPGTAVAVGAWLLLVPACLFALRWRTGRLMVCALLIYLVAHAAESTVIALELYFEHRNYFPGIGIFLLLAAALGRLATRWPALSAPLLAWLALYVLLLAFRTGSQVQIWSSAPVLRLNHVLHHPASFRANEEMALHLAGVGALDAALDYSRRAGDLSNQERTGDRQIRDIALYCLAGRPVPRTLLESLGTVEPRRPFAVVSTIRGFAQLLQRGVCPRADRIAFADRMAALFLGEAAAARASPHYYRVLAGIENDLGRFDRAHAYMVHFLARRPDDVTGLLMQLHFATALGRGDETAALKARLRDLDAAGRLSGSERDTLALYD